MRTAKRYRYLFVIITIIVFASCNDSEKKDLGKDKVHELMNRLKMGYDTTSYSVLHYDSLVNEFRVQFVSEGCIVFLGNSITEAGDWSRFLPNHKTINQGIGGDLTFGVLRRLNEVVRHKPSKVFLMIGINDLSRNVPDSLIVKNIFSIVETLHRELPKSQIIVQSLLPTNDEVENFPSGFNPNPNILAINQSLKANAHQCHYTYVDLHNHFANGSGLLNLEYTYDGIHLNSRGYQLWVEVLNSKELLQ